MKKPNKHRRRNRAGTKNVRSFGSALDEVGWKARAGRMRLHPGTIGPAVKARLRFEKATADIAAERRFGGPDHESSEIEIMEEATELVKQAKLDPD
jgi:hypothetical protein